MSSSIFVSPHYVESQKLLEETGCCFWDGRWVLHSTFLLASSAANGQSNIKGENRLGLLYSWTSHHLPLAKQLPRKFIIWLWKPNRTRSKRPFPSRSMMNKIACLLFEAKKSLQPWDTPSLGYVSFEASAITLASPTSSTEVAGSLRERSTPAAL